jgi:hypothetical protein
VTGWEGVPEGTAFQKVKDGLESRSNAFVLAREVSPEDIVVTGEPCPHHVEDDHGEPVVSGLPVFQGPSVRMGLPVEATGSVAGIPPDLGQPEGSAQSPSRRSDDVVDDLGDFIGSGQGVMGDDVDVREGSVDDIQEIPPGQLPEPVMGHLGGSDLGRRVQGMNPAGGGDQYAVQVVVFRTRKELVEIRFIPDEPVVDAVVGPFKAGISGDDGPDESLPVPDVLRRDVGRLSPVGPRRRTDEVDYQAESQVSSHPDETVGTAPVKDITGWLDSVPPEVDPGPSKAESAEGTLDVGKAVVPDEPDVVPFVACQ